MKKLVSLVVLLASLNGACASNCKDGATRVFWNTSYKSCKNECHSAGPNAEAKTCGCSNACPCWKSEYH